MSPLTRCTDVITVDDTTTLTVSRPLTDNSVSQSIDPTRSLDLFQSSLEAFTEAAESNYGCLTVNGRVCVATESW